MRRKYKTQIDDALRERMARAADPMRRDRLVRVPLIDCKPEPSALRVRAASEPIPVPALESLVSDHEWAMLEASFTRGEAS
jgi:hypothetical protein